MSSPVVAPALARSNGTKQNNKAKANNVSFMSFQLSNSLPNVRTSVRQSFSLGALSGGRRPMNPRPCNSHGGRRLTHPSA
jgi:hypothetical protein